MSRLPALFVSHGAPTFALVPGLAGPLLTRWGRTLAMPRAVLVVSPHWMTTNVTVGAVQLPETIHDFGGFAPALYEIQYPASGEPDVAATTAGLLAAAGWAVTIDRRRGLDHGAWVPLRYVYPEANVPVFQVSMPAGLDSRSAFRLGQALAPLADQGVLIVGSGSLTHNLREFRSSTSDVPAYVEEFVGWVRDTVGSGDLDRLQQTLALAPHAQRAHPTTEHFLPLLVAAGASAQGERSTSVLEGGYAHGVLSMESYVFHSVFSTQQQLQTRPVTDHA